MIRSDIFEPLDGELDDGRRGAPSMKPGEYSMAEVAVCYGVGDEDERPWGRWKVIGVGQGFIVKEITVNPGARLSAQYHNHRAEQWTLVVGEGEAEIDGAVRALRRGDHLHVPLQAVHRIRNTGSTPLIFVEVQVGDLLDETDIVRLSDDHGRTLERLPVE
jgi:mannose-6-phosphate isomerase